MQYAAKTHIGLKRRTNEDAYACAAEHGLFVIADGMGGMARGEEASRMAADQMRAGIVARLDPAFSAVSIDLKETLEHVMHAVQDHVAAQNGDRADTMGTTLLAVLVSDGALHYAHSGDSRAYVISSDGRIDRLTKDQTLAQRKIDRGADPVEANATHGHILTNYIGIFGRVEPEVSNRTLNPGDTIVLCTDGLTDMVPEEEIAETVTGALPDVERVADDLVARANANGGRDNTTVIVIRPD